MMSNTKSYLNQYSQKKHIATPSYKTESIGEGFSCTVTIEEAQYSSLSSHPTKKEAENDAAGVAVQSIIQTQPQAKNFEDVLKIVEQTSSSKSKHRPTQPGSTSSVGPEFVPVQSVINDTTTGTQQMSSSNPVYNLLPSGISSPHVRVLDPSLHRPLLIGNVPSANGIPVNYNTRAARPTPPPGFGPISHASPYGALHDQCMPPLPLSVANMPPLSHVYPNHPIAPNVQQPVSIPPGRIQDNHSPGQKNVRMPVMKPGSPAVLNSLSHETPRPFASNIPLSVVGPNIADLQYPTQNQNKPCHAIPVKSIGSSPSAVATTLVTNLPSQTKPQNEGSTENTGPSSENTDRDTKDLEDYCRVHNLPGPVYTISSDKGKHVGKVTIGEIEFSRGWKYDNFSDAKDSAAIVAIAGLAMSRLYSSPSPGNINGPSSPASPKTPQTPKLPSSNKTPSSQGPSLVLNHGQVRILKRTQPTSPVSVVTSDIATLAASTSLQTPAFFQQPIVARGGGDILTSPLHTSQQHISSTSDIQVLPQLASTAVTSSNMNFKNNAVGYVATVTVSGAEYKSSVQLNKRVAEGDAAQNALKALGALSLSGQGSVQSVGVSVPKQVSSSAPTVTASSKFVSYKNLLQEKAQKDKVSIPHYVTERSEKFDGFVSTVTVYLASGHSLPLSSTPHPVKKAAEQEAARLACVELKLIEK